MNMKETIEKLNRLQSLSESAVTECGDAPMAPVAPPTPEMPPNLSLNVSLNANATGSQHVNDLIDIMKNAGLVNAVSVQQSNNSMRQDMDSFRNIVNVPTLSNLEKSAAPSETYETNVDVEQEYMDTNYMTQDLAGGINKKKKAYKAAQRGDNAMAVETMKQMLYKKLKERAKTKPDFFDADKDGDKTEPMKKAMKDKKNKLK